MKAIAWDTSTPKGLVAAFEFDPSGRNFKLCASWYQDVKATHSERLLLGIDETLKIAGWSIQEVNLIGVGRGPGSFTGLRIGVTTANSLAKALHIPVVGFSSLSLLEKSLLSASLTADLEKIPDLFIVTRDACKGELFVSFTRTTAIPQNTEEHALTPQELVFLIHKVIKEEKVRSWAMVGDAEKQYPQAVSDFFELHPQIKQMRVFSQKFSPMDLSGEEMGKMTVDSFLSPGRENQWILPHYLRKSNAEIKLNR